MPISRVNSTLRRKKRMGILKKAAYTAIFILFFLLLLALLLTYKGLIVSTVSVSGNSSVSSDSISSLAESELAKRYLGFIRTDDWFLIRGSEIKKDILAAFPQIQSARIIFHGFTAIEIAVTERTPANLWCAGAPSSSADCYFMDSAGFIYAPAPNFGSNLYPIYYGLASSSPIGENYFNPQRFSQISALFAKLSDMQFLPEYFYAADEHEYEVDLSLGGKIYLSDSQSFDTSITNLQALIDNGYIKTSQAFLAKLNYIDLRFGNKVPFDLKK